MKRVFLNHIELWLSGLGLLVIVAVPYLAAPPAATWQTAALTAIAVGVIHGVLFWVVRRRGEALRTRARAQLEAYNEKLEERVRARTEQVRRLASRLTMAEQQERRRVSQILHDDLQQLLYGIQLKMSFIRRAVWSGEQEQLLGYADKASMWIDTAIETTRQLTVDLSPPVLDSDGLTDALQWLQTQMAALHDLHVELKAAHPFFIPNEDMRVLLFQIVRELLFNVVKHAETDHATVTLREGEADGHLIIDVVDEGRGFDVEGTEHAHDDGFGLFSARERVGLFGGRMEIASAPGAGTRVTVHSPTTLTTA